MAERQTIFLLGATGYLGSEFLILLARDLPQFAVRALVRDPTPERVNRLKEIHPNISVVEGTLEDDTIIQEQIQNVDIVVNSASSDHWPSIKCTLRFIIMKGAFTFQTLLLTSRLWIATLAGLEKNSASRPGMPPLYIHISGCGIISDDARGEPVEDIKEWSDIELDLKACVFRYFSSQGTPSSY